MRWGDITIRLGRSVEDEMEVAGSGAAFVDEARFLGVDVREHAADRLMSLEEIFVND